MKKALIFRGGWQGHDPIAVSERLASFLTKNGVAVEICDGTECLADKEYLLTLDLIVPCITMGEISAEQEKSVSFAVASGVGLAGCHGGMCDAFRKATEWQFMTGGQWVAHPGNLLEYTVNISSSDDPITCGIKDFKIFSEQYYLHVDPAIEVLATTRFPLANHYHAANKAVDMPVVWTKNWGLGRVFYCSLGHNDKVFADSPEASLIMERGMMWALDGKEFAQKNSLSKSKYEDGTLLYQN